MPLIINCGLNRKASQDFQSTGASINLTVELDSALLTHPDELQKSIDNIFDECRTALDRQTGEPAPPPQRQPARVNGNGHNGHTNRFASQNGNGNPSNNGRPMSDGQRRAIQAIARERGVDPYQSARATFNVDLDALNARQASEFIDNLKS